MIDVVKMTESEFFQYCEDSCGLCLECGEIRFGDTEPDAENYFCSHCSKNEVVGMENALVMGKIEFIEEIYNDG